MANNNSFWFSSKGLTALGLIAAVSYFLLIEHREHLFQLLPFLILLACPLMHMFMHRGHHHHSDTGNKRAGIDHSETSDDYSKGYQDGLKQSKHKKQREE